MPDNRFLLVGEFILDTTTPVSFPRRVRTFYRRAESVVYEQQEEEKDTLGGVFYAGRFLHGFGEVDVVFPAPTKGLGKEIADKEFQKIKGDADYRTLNPHAVEFQEAMYRARRFQEKRDRGASGVLLSPAHSFVRVDSGYVGSFHDATLTSLEEKMKESIADNPPSCILLADYDLGLFEHVFIRKVSDLVQSYAPDQPVVVYAGRRWSKFASIPNCIIVAERAEALEELSEMGGIDQNQAEEDPFTFIAARFPDIKSFVLVGGGKIQLASWEKYGRTGTLRGKVFTYQEKNRSPQTPVGSRALIAAFFTLKFAQNRDYQNVIISQTQRAHRCLHDAYEASLYNYAVLSGDFSQEDANNFLRRCQRRRGLGHSRGIPDFTVESRAIDIRLPEQLMHRIQNDGYELRLKDAETRVPGYYTTHAGLQKNVSDVYEMASKKQLPMALFDSKSKLAIQKLLITGPTGSGKTELAYAIARGLGSEVTPEKKFRLACNDIKAKTPEKKAETIVQFVKQNSRDRNVLLVDEINNMVHGRDVQGSLWERLDEPRTEPTGRKPLVIFAGSIREREMDKDTNRNKSDFYSRLQVKIIVPPISDRPLDPVYILASMLLENGVRRASLRGLMSVSGRVTRRLSKFKKKELELRQLTFWCNRLCEGRRGTLSDEDFKAAGFGLEDTVPANQMVYLT